MIRQRLLAVAALIVLVVGTTAADPLANVYSPVAPADAIHAAVESNLKLTCDWLNEKDYQSAQQTALGVSALLQLYGHQSMDKAWQERITPLLQASRDLATLARKKDAAGCGKIVQKMKQSLDELSMKPPSGPKVAVKNFKPAATTKTLMLLLEGAYVDAKTASAAKELEQLAYALAEGCNAMQFIRDEAWRQGFVETRDQALLVASKARGNDIAAAKLELKGVYTRCEACHQRSKQ